MPPYLAGRNLEQEEFKKSLQQRIILENIVLTGLRGVGKTVLLETFKPIARKNEWLWVGQDMSESASLSEHNLTERILADLAVVTSGLLTQTEEKRSIGFVNESKVTRRPLDYEDIKHTYESTPGLVSDKLKAVLLFVWNAIPPGTVKGIVFAYDEAQNLSDHAKSGQFPLSVMLDVFQSIQRMNIPYILVLTGLPTLFPKLVESRTYTERMFHVLFLSRLSDADSKDAILKPIGDERCPVTFSDDTVDQILAMSAGYPYFIQFICREIFNSWIVQRTQGEEMSVPTSAIVQKLDNDFFVGRWAKATDRQRDLMRVIASLPNCDSEFTVQEASDKSKDLLENPFSPSHVNQMLSSLSLAGLVFKNRHGKYVFAVPLLSRFIQRQQ